MSTMTDKMSQSSKSSMTQKMGEASATNGASSRVPKKGDHFRCQKCGMELAITADCSCNDPNHVHFECCGQEMARSNSGQ